jgi:hypothetical protein
MRFEINPAERCKASPDCLGQVRLGALIDLDRFAYDCTQLRFHRTAMLCRAHAQPLFAAASTLRIVSVAIVVSSSCMPTLYSMTALNATAPGNYL